MKSGPPSLHHLSIITGFVFPLVLHPPCWILAFIRLVEDLCSCGAWPSTFTFAQLVLLCSASIYFLLQTPLLSGCIGELELNVQHWLWLFKTSPLIVCFPHFIFTVSSSWLANNVFGFHWSPSASSLDCSLLPISDQIYCQHSDREFFAHVQCWLLLPNVACGTLLIIILNDA